MPHEESDVNIQPISGLTLRSHKNQRDLSRIAEVRHLGVVIVDGVEAGFVLQTEHKDDRVHPRRELQERDQYVGEWHVAATNKHFSQNLFTYSFIYGLLN